MILLEASPGFVLAQSGRCLGFGSRSDVDAVGDTVLPAAACSGSSERQVVVAMPEAGGVWRREAVWGGGGLPAIPLDF